MAFRTASSCCLKVANSVFILVITFYSLAGSPNALLIDAPSGLQQRPPEACIHADEGGSVSTLINMALSERREKSRSSLGLIDPHFDETRCDEILILRTDLMRLAHVDG
jgi:hypothetical protein